MRIMLYSMVVWIGLGTLFVSPLLAAPAKTHTNSVGMEFVLIPAGSFMMGADLDFEEGSKDETPVHKVQITKPFYLGKFEVIQPHWVKIMGSNPSKFKGRSLPVEQVSWDDIQRFIDKLNNQEPGSRYRLPTEAEWEYACRAGTSGAYSFGDDVDKASDYAWFDANSGSKTHPVGQKEPNPWGVHDMHGNVWEWVQDYYKDTAYKTHKQKDPLLSNGTKRVRRGASWFNWAGSVRCANRGADVPSFKIGGLGFRLVKEP